MEADPVDRVADDRAQAAEHQRHALARGVEVELSVAASYAARRTSAPSVADEALALSVSA
jgi:hypothetical protein